MNTTADTDLFAVAARAARWLDTRNGTGPAETAVRLLKVTEEAGEAAAAYIAATGQNPRKPVTGSHADVAAELADVVMAALVAMHALGSEPSLVVASCLAKLDARLPADTTTDNTADDPVDSGDPRAAATLRFLLTAHTTHGVPLPEDIDTNPPARVLRINVGNDQPELVRRWATLFGAEMCEPRESEHDGARWVNVEAQTVWGSQHPLGWARIEIRTVCDYTRPARQVTA